MNYRLFIAIPLPDNIKEAVEKKIVGCRGLPFRFARKENWHITVLFLGPQDSKNLALISSEVSAVAEKIAPFNINFYKIDYGPNPKNPRMIWLFGKPNKYFENLKITAEERLREKINFKIENRPAMIHITLARLYGNLEKPTQPIKEDINLEFEAEGIDLMESRTKRGGPEYVLFESYKFQNLEARI